MVDDLSFEFRVGIGASVYLSNANRNRAIARAAKTHGTTPGQPQR